MKVSDYNEGEIRRNQFSNYEYVVKGEVQGEYPNIDLLVHDNPVTNKAGNKPQTATKPVAKKAVAKKSSK